ncbi:MAG: (2Fe-2S)-binding protein [Myxococcales bacterium]|nr:(2Fe-2S)-binding protein [Myxococcales bacterium]
MTTEGARNSAGASGAQHGSDPGDEAVGSDNPIVCFCNEIRLSAIVTALEDGADSLPGLVDATFAGCGPCGGSCQPDLEAILEDWHHGAPDEP